MDADPVRSRLDAETRMRFRRSLVSAHAAALLLIGTAHGQVRGEAQLGVTGRYVWRGVTRTSKISLQPELAASAAHRSLGVAAGVWSNFELERGGADQRTALGVGRSGLAERDYWIGAWYAFDGGDVSAGFIRYNFLGVPALGGIGASRNTSELYATIDLRDVFLAPRVDFYVDVGRIDGCYLAGSVTAPFLAWPFPPTFSLFADASLGLNISQARDPSDPFDRADFDDTGITHARLGIRAMRSLSPWLTLSAGYRVQLNFDEATKDRIGPTGPRGGISGWGHVQLALHPADS
jgi:hypothetical protein